ncbi:2026_t:CDS:2 [Gigaspora margarita]|uniref:2026_t:CDS:1 n=1 Tax=Gigaspora margarita TaxID=4874 RepID=A0ABM8VVL2_GIGMA|nr:2026_t:CDS:2 [Gigaspora margarita]
MLHSESSKIQLDSDNSPLQERRQNNLCPNLINDDFDQYTPIFGDTIESIKEGHKFLTVEKKIEEGISLGSRASKTSLKKWVRVRMLEVLNVDTDKSEDRIFKALLHINFILINGISSKEELASWRST